MPQTILIIQSILVQEAQELKIAGILMGVIPTINPIGVKEVPLQIKHLALQTIVLMHLILLNSIIIVQIFLHYQFLQIQLMQDALAREVLLQMYPEV